MRRRWIVTLAVTAIALALADPAHMMYVVTQAHYAHIDVTASSARPLGSLPETLAAFLSLYAAIAAATLAAESRRWGRFAALLTVLLLFLGGLNPVGDLLAYFASFYLAAAIARLVPNQAASDFAMAVVTLAGPQLVTATAALLGAAFPGRPRAPAMPSILRRRLPLSTASRETGRSTGRVVVLFACAGGVLLLSSCVLVSRFIAP